MQGPRDVTNPQQLKVALDQLVKQFDNTGTVTLTLSSATTVVQNGKVNPSSVVVLTPRTANAAAALATTYVVPANGSFTITHANSTTASRTFGYVIHGV